MVSTGVDQPLSVSLVDSGGGLLLVERGSKSLLLVLAPDGDVASLAELPERPAGVAYDTEAGVALVQLGWVPLRGTEPNLERRVYLWDLGTKVLRWSARPRFVADELRIETPKGLIELRSRRYGRTVLRLTDGYLLRDAGKSGRDPEYPGVVAGAVGRRPMRK